MQITSLINVSYLEYTKNYQNSVRKQTIANKNEQFEKTLYQRRHRDSKCRGTGTHIGMLGMYRVQSLCKTVWQFSKHPPST